MKRKIILGFVIFIGFFLLSFLYIEVMRNVTLVHGEVTVHSAITGLTNVPAIGGQGDVVHASGYDVKRNTSGKTQLLSTKNKEKRDGLSYSFYARRDDQAQIVLYLQMDRLTGELGQTMEVHFLIQSPVICRTHWDFNLLFENKKGADVISITANGKVKGESLVHQCPVDQIPAIIEI